MKDVREMELISTSCSPIDRKTSFSLSELVSGWKPSESDPESVRQQLQGSFFGQRPELQPSVGLSDSGYLSLFEAVKTRVACKAS